MSEELNDEVEAINSIYGEGSLVQDKSDLTIYILSLPDGASSLRLQFSTKYPVEPPAVLGTHSAGDHGKRGIAARDLEVFRAAVAEVYEPGQVCLFDAIEKFKDVTASTVDESLLDGNAQETEPTDQDAIHTDHVPPVLDLTTLQAPPWILSSPLIELRSTFVARCARVTSSSLAAQYVEHLLATDKKVRAATHNITAWRIRGANGTSFQDCDDDGETAAGGRLLHLLQLADLWDVMVVVTRWYGGQKLGPRRFALINQVAREACVKAGVLVEGAKGGKKGQHGKS